MASQKWQIELRIHTAKDVWSMFQDVYSDDMPEGSTTQRDVNMCALGQSRNHLEMNKFVIAYRLPTMHPNLVNVADIEKVVLYHGE